MFTMEFKELVMEVKGKHRLRRYIFVILLVSALLPVSTLGFWMIITNSERIEAVMQDDLTMLSENQIRSIESFCSNRKENMDMVVTVHQLLNLCFQRLSVQ